jgi:hypothetical protein
MKFLYPLLLLPALLTAQEWTMLVYIAADNNLAQWADSDLVEMEMYGSNNEIRVVVQIDKPSIGAKRLLVGQGSSQTLQTLGVIDMCSPETLGDFLAWGITRFPADKYLIVLWDHGTGWTAMPRRSFGTDWSSGNVLSVANGDLQQAFQAAYEFTAQRVDLLAFDACLMQQIEIAFELKKYARLLLAPQSIMPLAGFRYDEILEALHANPDIGASGLSRRLIQSTVNNYTDLQPIAISSINLSRMDEVTQHFKTVASHLMPVTPDSAIYSMRMNVQTIPAFGCIPDTTDDFVDLGDFFEGLYQLYGTVEAERLFDCYTQAVVYAEYWGDDFANTTGLTIWFPDRYVQFKQLLGYYDGLDWFSSEWPRFLNWFYNSDDIRPSSISLQAGNIGRENDFRLSWTRSHDLSDVTYSVAEASATSIIFSDPCEDSSFWHLNGFTLSSTNYHSGSHSFFSGNASNLQNYMETTSNILIEEVGLLSIFLYHNTEEAGDSLIIEYGPFIDVHYGNSHGWIERRSLLPAGNYPLRISYHTNSAVNMGGCYLDDISLHEMTGGHVIRSAYEDTSLYLYNELRGDHVFAVYAEDRYNNRGNMSNLLDIYIEHYAEPYSIPNPFQDSCSLVLDYPEDLHPTVEIYSLSGVRVRSYEPVQIINNRISWDGRDEGGRSVGSGVYFIVVKDSGFSKTGKIARQR